MDISGTSKVLRIGSDLIMIIDEQGTRTIMRNTRKECRYHPFICKDRWKDWSENENYFVIFFYLNSILNCFLNKLGIAGQIKVMNSGCS